MLSRSNRIDRMPDAVVPSVQHRAPAGKTLTISGRPVTDYNGVLVAEPTRLRSNSANDIGVQLRQRDALYAAAARGSAAETSIGREAVGRVNLNVAAPSVPVAETAGRASTLAQAALFVDETLKPTDAVQWVLAGFNEIIVTGSPPGNIFEGGAGGAASGGNGNETGNSPDPMLAPDTGGGAEGSTDYLRELQRQCHADSEADLLAREIENQIKSQPDWNAREYGALIYVNGNGNLKIGTLTRGMTVAEAQRAGFGAPRTTFSTPTDLGSSGYIVAAVHSHPDIGYSSRFDLENRYPSNNPGDDGDYQTFARLIGADSRFTNSAEFSQYILGPDGILREFNFSEGIVNRSNDKNPMSRSDLSSDRRHCSELLGD